MDYVSLLKFLDKLNSDYKIKSIGTTYLKNKIFVVTYKPIENKPWVIITAGIHAREHLSTDIVCKQIVLFSKFAEKVSYNVAFIPQINPDGANLCKNNTKNMQKSVKNRLICINKCKDFTFFKANARGVDLNNNFDANWGNQFSEKKLPSSSGYYGKKPFSEKESRALANFTKKLKPFITISYHLKGEEIYYDFFQNRSDRIRDYKIAKVFAKSTGYKIKSTQNVSSGGYKDWCVQHLKIPALTIELGNDKFSHPYPKSEIKNIWQKNKNVFLCLEESLKIYNSFGETNE